MPVLQFKLAHGYCMHWRKLLCTFHPAAQNSPPRHSVAAGLCLFLPVVLFKFSPCAALVIKSLKHKAGSMGSVYSFPKSIILHINHWSGTFGQCWICYLFIFFPLFWLLSLWVWQFTSFKLHFHLMTFSSD